MIRIYIQFAFLRGEYAQYDMSGLDLRLVRDWAVFTALSSAGQGTNREAAWSRYLNNTGAHPWPSCVKQTVHSTTRSRTTGARRLTSGRSPSWSEGKII